MHLRGTEKWTGENIIFPGTPIFAFPIENLNDRERERERGNQVLHSSTNIVYTVTTLSVRWLSLSFIFIFFAKKCNGNSAQGRQRSMDICIMVLI